MKLPLPLMVVPWGYPFPSWLSYEATPPPHGCPMRLPLHLMVVLRGYPPPRGCPVSLIFPSLDCPLLSSLSSLVPPPASSWTIRYDSLACLLLYAGSLCAVCTTFTLSAKFMLFANLASLVYECYELPPSGHVCGISLSFPAMSVPSPFLPFLSCQFFNSSASVWGLKSNPSSNIFAKRFTPL